MSIYYFINQFSSILFFKEITQIFDVITIMQNHNIAKNSGNSPYERYTSSKSKMILRRLADNDANKNSALI